MIYLICAMGGGIIGFFFGAILQARPEDPAEIAAELDAYEKWLQRKGDQ